MAPNNRNSNAEIIAAAVAAALARSNSEAAQAVAKSATEAAAELAKTQTQTALAVATVSQDISYIRSQLTDLVNKVNNLGNMYVGKEEHKDAKDQLQALEKKVGKLEQKFWLAQGAFAVIFVVVKFLIPGLG